MGEVWFTADTHFSHRAMARDGKGWRPFDTVTEHDEYLIEQWNKTVRPDDQVWHLGDVGLGSEHYVLDCVLRLNGTKHLIAGNHDPVWPGHRHSYKSQRDWLEVFSSVQAFARRRLAKGEDVLLSHFPYTGDHHAEERYSEYRLHDTGLPLLHGHVHREWSVRGRQINVGVDVHEWRPITLGEVRALVADV
jgi:calcineurin-like phosphoesterase family protein